MSCFWPTTAPWLFYLWRCCWPPATATAAPSCATRAGSCCRARTAGGASARSTSSACAKARSIACTWLIWLTTKQRPPSSASLPLTSSSLISRAGTTSRQQCETLIKRCRAAACCVFYCRSMPHDEEPIRQRKLCTWTTVDIQLLALIKIKNKTSTKRCWTLFL